MTAQITGGRPAAPAGHYDVLGVSRDATFPELRAAFKRRALEVHPDKKKGSQAEFLAVFQALEVLQDEMKRRSYDAQLACSVPTPLSSQQAVRKRHPGPRQESASQRQRLGPNPADCPEAMLFSLLQQLPSAARREVLERELSTSQREALQAWASTHRDHVRASSAAVAASTEVRGSAELSESTGADELFASDGEGTPKLALEDFGGGLATLHEGKHKEVAFKGITSLSKGTTRMYIAGVHFENISVACKAVRDLDVALENWVFLSALKREVQVDTAEGLGTRLPRALQRALDRECKTEKELGLSYVIRLKQSFWAGRRNISTPRLKSVEQVVRAWDRLEPQCVQSRGAAGHVRRSNIEELQGKWSAFQEAFADVCEEAGCSRCEVLAKLKRWEAENQGHREQLLQRWETQRERQEALQIARAQREKDIAAKVERRTLEQVHCAIAQWSQRKAREVERASMQSPGKLAQASQRSGSARAARFSMPPAKPSV